MFGIFIFREKTFVTTNIVVFKLIMHKLLKLPVHF